jgi:hypothetical protein
MMLKAEQAIYLYGFTLSDSSLSSEAVMIYQYAGLAAMISLVDVAEFTGELGELNLQNVEWLTPRVCRHGWVIEKFSQQGAVYPLPFGTLFSSFAALQQTMSQRAEQVLSKLEQIAGCQEWALEASLDRQQAVEVLLAEGLANGRFSLPETLGRRHLEEQKLRRHLLGQLNDWLAECLAAQWQILMRLARDARQRKLGDDKVLNWAFLLAQEHLPAFELQIALLSQHYQPYGFQFRLTGPWAAYSFVN